MSGASFRAFFPAWERFAAHVDPRFSSSFWRRVTAVTLSAARRVLIVGATSAIAAETARAYAERGATAVPDRPRLRPTLPSVADDLRVRGAAARWRPRCWTCSIAPARAGRRSAARSLGGLDVALIAHGILPDQAAARRARRRRRRRPGGQLHRHRRPPDTCSPTGSRPRATASIAVITSVAGDRGRQSNYVYGAAKGGVGDLPQGLRQPAPPVGRSGGDAEAGFRGHADDRGHSQEPLFASARRAGRAIYRAIERRRSVAYIPWFWRPIMVVIKSYAGGDFQAASTLGAPCVIRLRLPGPCFRHPSPAPSAAQQPSTCRRPGPGSPRPSMRGRAPGPSRVSGRRRAGGPGHRNPRRRARREVHRGAVPPTRSRARRRQRHLLPAGAGHRAHPHALARGGRAVGHAAQVEGRLCPLVDAQRLQRAGARGRGVRGLRHRGARAGVERLRRARREGEDRRRAGERSRAAGLDHVSRQDPHLLRTVDLQDRRGPPAGRRRPPAGPHHRERHLSVDDRPHRGGPARRSGSRARPIR